jgi:sec-independent protein translocase protein TatA
MFEPVVLVPGLPGGPELLIVLFVVVLLFGANRIPGLARAGGQAMGEFKRGRDEVETELREAVGDGEEERGRSRS